MKSIGGWRNFDEELNLIYPWYTSPFLKKLSDWDLSNWYVFEYGAGDSTIWWKKKSRKVISVDNNEIWSQKTESYYSNDKETYINFPKQFINESLFDCIIIDGEPVSWRDDCIIPALDCLKNGGILIIDNYKQGSVALENWIVGEKVLNNLRGEVFQEPTHQDWKTGYWIK